MLKVGLTGNIGSGKTLVANIFEKIGISVFHADIEAGLMFESDSVKDIIRDVFGERVFSTGGSVLRKELASIVFHDRDKLKKLNSIIHPLVRNKYQEWCVFHSAGPYTLYEAAILFESGYYKAMDRIICITAPEALRIQRVMERDNIKLEAVKQRMSNQWDEDEKVRRSDYLIINDGNTLLIPQVMDVHKRLRRAQGLGGVGRRGRRARS